MPTKQSLGSDEERSAPPQQEGGGHRQEAAFGRPQVRPGELAAQDGQLAAKDDDHELRVFGRAKAGQTARSACAEQGIGNEIGNRGFLLVAGGGGSSVRTTYDC